MAIWLALSAAATAVACAGMLQAFAASEDCLALSLNAFAALLVSPFSWSHHWVWCVPALLTLAALGVGHRSRLSLAAACVGLLIFAAAPQFWLPHGRNLELRWAAWQQITGSSYVIFAAFILLLALSAAMRRVLWQRPWPGRLRPVRWAPGEQGGPMSVHLFLRKG
jgi:alpha-1,2-mannosyltransferase